VPESGAPAGGPPDERPRFTRLRKRAEFQHAAKGLRFNTPVFALQSIRRSAAAGSAPGGEARFGFTVTKKTGNAVERARMRRRLKEAIRCAEGLPVRDGHDYVFVARREALRISFPDLSAEIVRALGEVGARADRKSREPKRPAQGQ
jgi:ribonuclease P protein component